MRFAHSAPTFPRGRRHSAPLTAALLRRLVVTGACFPRTDQPLPRRPAPRRSPAPPSQPVSTSRAPSGRPRPSSTPRAPSPSGPRTEGGSTPTRSLPTLARAGEERLPFDSAITLQPERLVTDRQGRGLNDAGFDPARGVTVTARYVVPVAAGGRRVALYPHGCAVSMEEAQWRAIATRSGLRQPLPIYRLKLLATPLPRRDGIGVLAMQLPEYDGLDQTVTRALSGRADDSEMRRRVDPLPYRIVAPERGDVAIIDVEWARLSVLDALPISRCTLMAVLLQTNAATLSQMGMGPRTAAAPPETPRESMLEPRRISAPPQTANDSEALSVAARRTMATPSPARRVPTTDGMPIVTGPAPSERSSSPALVVGRATARGSTPSSKPSTRQQSARTRTTAQSSATTSSRAARPEPSRDAPPSTRSRPPSTLPPATGSATATGTPAPAAAPLPPSGGLVFGRSRPASPPATPPTGQAPTATPTPTRSAPTPRVDSLPNRRARSSKLGTDSGSWVDLRLLRRTDSTGRR